LRGTYKVNWALCLRQRESGVLGVASQLLDQRLYVLKPGGVAEAPHELDGNALAVPVTRHIEQVYLERAAGLSERGPRAKVHHAVEPTSRRSRANRVYPLGREKFAGRPKLDVERWISEIAPSLLAGNHDAAECIGSSQHALDSVQVAVGKRRADRARRNGDAEIIDDRRNDVDAESMPAAQLGQNSNVPLPAPPEAAPMLR